MKKFLAVLLITELAALIFMVNNVYQKDITQGTRYFWTMVFDITKITLGINDSVDQIVIATANTLHSFEPTQDNESASMRLKNIYEGLTMFDEDLRLQPALARSFSNLDDFTWEFDLRRRVKFHNGDSFDADDFIASYERARDSKISKIKEILSNIQSIKKNSPYNITIKTKDPDPLLPNKLSHLLIIPKKLAGNPAHNLAQTPVGTGPYRFAGWEYSDEGNKESLQLEKYKQYWGRSKMKTAPSLITIKSIINKFTLAGSLLKDQVDLTDSVPVSSLGSLKARDTFAIIQKPALTNISLYFNQRHEQLQNQEIREAIAQSLSDEGLQKLVGENGKVAREFIPTGVFGYNPEILPINFSLEDAEITMKNNELENGFPIVLDLDPSLEKVGQFIRRALFKINIRTKLNIIPAGQLLSKINNGTSDMYLLSYKFEDGDSGDFLRQLFASQGQYNGMGYNNPKVNQLIETAAAEMNEKKRLQTLQEAISKIAYDIPGVALFDTQKIYAVKKKINWEPRIDGYILGAAISGK